MAGLINKNDISFRCSYGGECMAEIEDCKICVHYVCDYEDIQNVDVITEQEIRAKAIDEFTEELNNSIDMLDLNYEYRCDGGVQHQTLNNMRIMIQEIAEQLKAGDNNE